jgi:hypothetical protein
MRPRVMMIAARPDDQIDIVAVTTEDGTNRT